MNVEGQAIPNGACAPTGRANLNQVAVTVSLFYSDKEEDIEAAKAICAACPARTECLDIGMSERFGVWGGHTADERRHLRKVVKHR